MYTYIYIHKDYSIYIYIAGLSCFFSHLISGIQPQTFRIFCSVLGAVWGSGLRTPVSLSFISRWAEVKSGAWLLNHGWMLVVWCFFLRNGEVDPALCGFIFSILKLWEYSTLRISVDFIHGQFDGMMTARFFQGKTSHILWMVAKSCTSKRMVESL